MNAVTHGGYHFCKRNIPMKVPGYQQSATPAITHSLLAVLMMILAACGANDDSRYTVGGTINGLNTSGLVLAMGLDMVKPEGGSASFSFGTALPKNASYKVVVEAQPAGQTCSVKAGTESGTIDTSNITSVVIDCVSQWIWQSGS